MDFVKLELFLKKSSKLATVLLIADSESELGISKTIDILTTSSTKSPTILNLHLIDKFNGNFKTVPLDPLLPVFLPLHLVQSLIVLDSVELFITENLEIWYAELTNLVESAANCLLVFLYRSRSGATQGIVKSTTQGTVKSSTSGINCIQVLKDIAQCHINLTTAEFLLKKKSGKIFKDSFSLKTMSLNPLPVQVEKLDPISSFNLSLTDTQRAQKDGMVLPYVMNQKESVIDYIADKQDDFDSDDLDDDLDI